MQLKNRKVVIIGGSSGIGFATAELPQAEGATVTITGRNRDKLDRAAQKLGDVKTAIVDITDEVDIQQLMAQFDHMRSSRRARRKSGIGQGGGYAIAGVIALRRYIKTLF